MSINQHQNDGKVQSQVGTPAATYLISQGAAYYPLTNDSTEGQAPGPRPCCNGAFEPAKQTAVYDYRDVYSMKPNIKVHFAEAFQEPQGSESFEAVWQYNKAIYSWTMRCFYSFLTGLLGPFLAIAWGLIFATMNFILVWFFNPFIRLFLQVVRLAEILNRALFGALIDPLFQSIGQMFTYLRGTFNLSLDGIQGLVAKKENGSSPTFVTGLPLYHESRA